MFESKEEYEQFLKENVMSTRDAAEFLEITRKGISYLVKNNKLKPFKDQDRVRLFSRKEVERYKKKRNG